MREHILPRCAARYATTSSIGLTSIGSVDARGAQYKLVHVSDPRYALAHERGLQDGVVMMAPRRKSSRGPIVRIPRVSSPYRVPGFARERDPSRGFHALITVTASSGDDRSREIVKHDVPDGSVTR